MGREGGEGSETWACANVRAVGHGMQWRVIVVCVRATHTPVRDKGCQQEETTKTEDKKKKKTKAVAKQKKATSNV